MTAAVNKNEMIPFRGRMMARWEVEEILDHAEAVLDFPPKYMKQATLETVMQTAYEAAAALEGR